MFHRFDHAALGPVTVLGPPVRVDADGFVAGAVDAAFRQRGARDPERGPASARPTCSGLLDGGAVTPSK